MRGGLPAAAYLQKSGLDVLVVEANSEVGCFCCSHETWAQTLDSPHVGVSFAGNSPVIAPLKAALAEEASRLIVNDGATPEAREVTIMGDKAIPFRLLKKVMATCTDAAYERIALAVVQKEVKVSARGASRT